MKKVDLAIIGIHKAGTTSLFEMIKQHPSISTHVGGQFPYIFGEDDYQKKYKESLSKHVDSIGKESTLMIRDMSLSQNMAALKNFRTLFPDAKLVISLREPVSRAYSAYCYSLTTGYQNSDYSFDQVLADWLKGKKENNEKYIKNYISMGFYFELLRKIEQIFPLDQLLIIDIDHIKSDAKKVCNDIFSFSGLNHFDVENLHRNKIGRPKSEWAASFLQQDSMLKKISKKLLPVKSRVALLRKFGSINRSTEKYLPLNEEQKTILQNIFDEDLKNLKEHYGISFK